MKKGSKYITHDQRILLEDCVRDKIPKRKIAEKIGMSLSTVYREIKRGYCKQRRKKYDSFGDSVLEEYETYCLETAEERAKMEMTKKGAPLKIGNDHDFAAYVEKRVIDDRISPCVLIGEMNKSGNFRTKISKSTLYRYISKGFFLNLSMEHLPYYKKKKRYRKTVAKRAPRGTSIDKRPVEILTREEFGHWEMDSIVGKTKATLLALTERKTRMEIIFLMPNRTTKSVIHSLNVLENRYGDSFTQIFKSVTVDNGVEFSDCKGMEESVFGNTRTKFYYCHPYTSCERGSNERINRDIRKIFPKGTNFSKVSQQQVQWCEDWVNRYPREMFDFGNAAERFEEELAKLV